MGVLALEYRLLKNENKDTKSTLNELYYAIQAINRMDDKAEVYFSFGNQAGSRNGFLLRGDGDQQLTTFFNNEYSTSQDPHDNISFVESESTNESGAINQPTTDARKAAAFSKDHIIDLTEGFTFVKKFVDDQVIQPTPNDAPMHLHDEIKNIVNRIMGWVTQTHQIDYFTFPNNTPEIKFKNFTIPGYSLPSNFPCQNNGVKWSMNWLIYNPIYNDIVPKGNNINILAYPIANIAKNLTGTAWDAIPVKIKLDGSACSSWEFQVADINLNIGSPTDVLPHTWIMASQGLSDLTSLAYDPFYCENLSPIPGINLPGQKQLCLKMEDILPGVLDASKLNDVYQMGLTLGTVSNTWQHQDIVNIGDSRFLYHYDLMFAVLNNTATIHDKTWFENILNTAPCSGPYNYNYPNNDPATGLPSWDPIWHHNNRWVHPMDANNIFNVPGSTTNPNEQGEFHGLDYMLLYNMYRLYFYNQINMPFGQDNSCSCTLNPVIEANTDASLHQQLQNNSTIYRKFSAYKAINIYLKEYINNNLFIQNSKTLTNKTDLIICNNAQVIINNGGKLENAATTSLNDSIKIIIKNGSKVSVGVNGTVDIASNTKMLVEAGSNLIAVGGKIYVRSGAQLIIEPGANFEIGNGGQLIVEDGGQVIVQGIINPGGQSGNYGKLTYRQGAQIQLKGNNAVLELNGQLYIDNNAQFTFTYPGSNSGYLKFNRGNVYSDNYAPGNAMISCGTGVTFQLTGQGKNDKIIDIRQIDLHMPDQMGALTINNGRIEFNEKNAMLSVPVKCVFNNVTFQGTPSYTAQPEPTRGVVIYGTPLQNFTNCDFNDLGTGLMAALHYGGYNLNAMNNCSFSRCMNGILIDGAGAVIKNTQFTNNQYGIIGNIMNNSTMLTNNINSTGSYANSTRGVILAGAPVTLYMEGNSIQHQFEGMHITGDVEAKLKCTGLTNNLLGYFGDAASKLNMSTLLGAGYVNASANQQFASFYSADYWETEQGRNSFKISDNSPCYYTTGTVGHPAIQHCPTISEGSLLSFINFNTTTGFYEISGTGNYWRFWNGMPLEFDYNKIQKTDVVNGNVVISGAHVVDNSPLIFQSLPCVNGSGVSLPFTPAPANFIHPLDNNSPSTSITTASFYNKKLSYALNFSLEKMTDMSDVPKINQAADLLTEVLQYNYAVPVTNYADKYLLELAYQKLFSCVAQLTQIYKPVTDSLGYMPATLLPRYSDLLQIIALRTGRKDINDPDYKTKNDLILLDKAMVYRLKEDRPSAISIISNIIASNPKAEHRYLYEYWNCVFANEQNSITHQISVPDAMTNITKCAEQYKVNYVPPPAQKPGSGESASEVMFANEYAIAVLPNPTAGNLEVNYDLQQFESVTLDLFDVQGKKMKTYPLSPLSRTYHIDNLELDNGIYFYRLTGDGKVLMNQKLVIAR